MSTAQNILVTYGLAVLSYGLVLGIPLAVARSSAPQAPRHLVTAHLSGLMQCPIVLGLAFAIGSVSFDSAHRRMPGDRWTPRRNARGYNQLARRCRRSIRREACRLSIQRTGRTARHPRGPHHHRRRRHRALTPIGRPYDNECKRHVNQEVEQLDDIITGGPDDGQDPAVSWSAKLIAA